ARTGDAEPLYVVRLDPETRRVIVGPRAALACDSFTVSELNWLGDAETLADASGHRVMIKIRSASPAAPARILHLGDGRARIVPEEPLQGVAPGQACVLYDGDRVLGGGWIDRRVADTTATSISA